MHSFLFDSYAIIELLKGNISYAPYRSAAIITTKLNIFEVYYILLRELGEESADTFLKDYYQFAIEYDDGVIRESTHYKLLHNTRNLSMTDCIGYAVSIRMGIRFLTGDKEFKELNNVEFVK